MTATISQYSAISFSANDLLAILTNNVGAQRGITAAVGSPNTNVQVTIDATATTWALLADGTFFTPAALRALATADLLVPAVKSGANALWLGVKADGTPYFYVGLANAPANVRDLTIGTVTVASTTLVCSAWSATLTQGITI